MAKGLILIVEDEPEIADLVRFHVEREGFRAQIAATGTEALAAVARETPDLVLLDIMLPDLDGLEICKRIKASPETAACPVVILSAKGDETDVVAGLALGADDYVAKPFSPKVLIARIKSVLRRHRSEENTPLDNNTRCLVIASGRISIDPLRHTVSLDGELVELTLSEFKLLHYLARRPGFVRTRNQIVAAVRGEGAVLSSRAVDVHIASLRRKLGPMGDIVETVRGVGYRMAEEAQAERAASA